MSEFQNVIDQMSANGLTGISTLDLVVDGQIHRFTPDWEKKRNKKRGWYVLFEFVSDRGDKLVSGAYGWFKGSECFQFNVQITNEQTLSDSERVRNQKDREEKLKQLEIERQKQSEEAANRAEEIWKKLPDNGASEYLFRKRVKNYGLKFSRGSIIIPVRDLKGSLHGLQFISGDGSKKFLTGTRKKGNFHLIGKISQKEKLCIAEGYATAASIHEATGFPVAVSFDAGNLQPVAEMFRNKFPNLKITICGDDDQESEINHGREKAEKAAFAIKGGAVFPTVARKTYHG